MKKEPLDTLFGYYRRNFKQFGDDPRSLGYFKGRQKLRFRVLADVGLRKGNSILDVGCGFADFYDFLTEAGWSGRYTGVDLVPEFIATAHQRHPDIDVRVYDFQDARFQESYDFVVASGIFQLNIFRSERRHWSFIKKMLTKMYSLADIAVSADFLSTYVDYQQEHDWHTSPEKIFSFCKTLSKRVELRHDYMPYEFTVYLYKDDSISTDSVFKAYPRHKRESSTV